jgi:RHH-type proline utilization regulon transcriptional repressor/proline dehydrogenase/delta 1-pyrroline-5-carboxylate dehydrogenase
MVCISPWNFPLAIFTGQLAAALMAGNAVLAKPAEQTTYMAQRAVELFHKAGVPADVLQLIPGSGSTVGAALVDHPEVAGVIFTGSTEVAQSINQTLANKNGPIVPLIAETGGQNTMIVDSTALLEQVVMDVSRSAFDSAGQRCSALRVLCVQEDIADDLIHMIKGQMNTLKVGDPALLRTDVGPVIDAGAQRVLQEHIEAMRARGFPVYQIAMTDYAEKGTFVPPTLIEIDNLSALKREVFGPVLHVLRYSANKISQLIQDINHTGYGLTFGMHSRNESQYHHVVSRVNIGNAYINRNIVGAVVGVQPFGGEGLSGTGPKAGGPNYMMRLVHEHALSINTVAMGGNASLLSLSDDEDEVAAH